jgi:hypothetical protein
LFVDSFLATAETSFGAELNELFNLFELATHNRYDVIGFVKGLFIGVFAQFDEGAKG